jgi:outer membrane protein assembly factor BamB
VLDPLAAGDPRQIGAYRLQARPGAGGMGHVFLGFSPAGRPVAVKVIHAQLGADPAFRARLRREAAAAQSVSGAYTAPVVAAGPDDDPPWLATVLVAGPSLAEAVATAGPLPTGPARRLAVGLAEALAEIHGRGLIHRDLKPANVLLALDGPRVIDFGISRALEATAMTAAGVIVGTPSFMSPEQACGAPVGPASDVFALGGVLVFATTRAGPFGDGLAPSLLYRVVHSAPALGHVPAELRDLAAACLAKDPGDRPSLPELMGMLTVGAPPLAASLASFWPETVADLIRDHQARLDAQLGRSPARETGPPRAEPEPRPQAQTTVTAARAAAPVPSLPAESAGLTGHPPHRVTRMPHVARPTRRQALAGLAAGAAAGLGAAGWELSRGGRPAPGTELWSTGIRGGITSGPLVARGVVYVVSPYSLTGSDARLHALSAADGSLIWSSSVSSGVSSAPAIARDVIYIGGGDRKLYALSAGDASHIWSSAAGGGLNSNPVVAGGLVHFAGADGRVHSLRAADGSPVWSSDSRILASMLVAADGIVYVLVPGAVAGPEGTNPLYALNADRGVQLWISGAGGGVPQPCGGRRPRGGRQRGLLRGQRPEAVRAERRQRHRDLALRGRPGTVHVPGGVRRMVCYAGYDKKVHALNAASGSPIWNSAAGQPDTDLVVADGVVYYGGYDRRLHALNAADGAQIWASRAGGGPASSLAVTAGAVYFYGFDERLQALSA